MVDKADIVSSIPTSSTINLVADGEVVDASIENTNNEKLLSTSTLLYQFVRDDCPALGVANTFTAEQIFNILRASQIRPAITNGDLTLNPNGTGKVRYADGSGNTEVASKGYVNLAAGNIPPGGTSSTFLRGDGTWVAISSTRVFCISENGRFNFYDTGVLATEQLYAKPDFSLTATRASVADGGSLTDTSGTDYLINIVPVNSNLTKVIAQLQCDPTAYGDVVVSAEVVKMNASTTQISVIESFSIPDDGQWDSYEFTLTTPESFNAGDCVFLRFRRTSSTGRIQLAYRGASFYFEEI